MAMPEKTDPQFRLRVPGDLRKRIADAASDNNRSSNSEIVSRLSHSFMTDDRLARIEGKLDILLGQQQEPVAERRAFLDAAGRVVPNPDAAWDSQR